MSADRGDNTTTIPAHVEDPRTLKGKYLRNIRTDRIVKILDVGREGVIASSVTPDAYGGEPSGEPHGITWAALTHIYNIMVPAEEVKGTK